MNYDEDILTIGKKIKQLREQQGLTQSDLAEKLGTSRVAVSKWETGKKVPLLGEAERIIVYFQITLDELIGGKHTEVNCRTMNVTQNAQEEKTGFLMYLKLVILCVIAVIMGPNGVFPVSYAIYYCLKKKMPKDILILLILIFLERLELLLFALGFSYVKLEVIDL